MENVTHVTPARVTQVTREVVPNIPLNSSENSYLSSELREGFLSTSPGLHGASSSPTAAVAAPETSAYDDQAVPYDAGDYTGLFEIKNGTNFEFSGRNLTSELYDEFNFTSIEKIEHTTRLLEFSQRSAPYTNSNAVPWGECFDAFWRKTNSDGHDPSSCQIKFDGASCWPETGAGALSVIPCFAELNGVLYDTRQNATLQCFETGDWASQANYDFCTELVPLDVEHAQSSNTKLLIFYVGYSISLVAVLVALAVFSALKDLRCLRNTIHANLLATYLLHNVLWLTSASILFHVHARVDCGFTVLLKYAELTNFMWMFVEGLYLYVLVVKTFSVENIKLKVYLIIGWAAGIPIILSWALARYFSLNAAGGPQDFATVGCFLHHESPLDWLVRVPIFGVLATNILFVCRIMWVLITKLRSANTVETQRYRKATKAMLVLNPLLGLNYVLLIALPQELEHLHPCLLSTQGLWVALFYCFLNSEVQNSIRHHIARWRTERGLLNNSRSLEKLGRDASPRGGSRLSSYSRRFFAGIGNKRESVCSEVTTTTTFITNGSNQPHHNFHYQKTSKQLLPLHHFPTPSNSGPATLQPRHFRHSQPNLSQVSYFNTTRNCAEASESNTVNDSNVENLLPTYRPVSRSSSRTPSPFDPPNIPLITPPILTPSGTGETLHDNDSDLLQIRPPLSTSPETIGAVLSSVSTSDASCKAEDKAPYVKISSPEDTMAAKAAVLCAEAEEAASKKSPSSTPSKISRLRQRSSFDDDSVVFNPSEPLL